MSWSAAIQLLGGLECCEIVESGVAWDVGIGARADTRGVCLQLIQWRLVGREERSGFSDLVSQVWNEAR